MKKYISLLLMLNLFGFGVQAQNSERSYKDKIDSSISLMKSEKYSEATEQLLAISKLAKVDNEKAQIKYLLGLSLMELNLNQTAAFQFVDVITAGNALWTRSAIEKLLITTDKLGDETLLDFAIQRIDINQFPEKNREMLYYRIADIKYKAGQYKEAIGYYSKISSKSRYYYNSLYNLGLIYAEENQPDQAIQNFEKLLKSRSLSPVTDTNKVAAQMGIARALYQKKEWGKSIEAYSKIPRDHNLWHSALFEQTWAMMRAARFRSTLSNFQSLHSSYYEDAYLPETLLLRAIVYLYICQYDEMEKVVALFETQYEPSLKKISAFLASSNMDTYFSEINAVFKMKKKPALRKQLGLPYNILKYVSEDGEVRKTYSYYKKITEEKRILEESSEFKNSALLNYAEVMLNNRIKSTKLVLGELTKNNLNKIKIELTTLSEQMGFVKYEMISGKKESLKKSLTAKEVVKPEKSVAEDRSFYIKNGYEYYPFQGEYWLDEIGNFHYLGKQNCE